MQQRAFSGGMAALTTNFNPEPSKERDRLYRAALDDLSDAAFLAAIAEIVKKDHFFPKVARIREVSSQYAASEYRAVLMAPTPSESIYGELAEAWNGGDGVDALSRDARRIAKCLDWERRETVSLVDVIRAVNEIGERATDVTIGAQR